MKKYTYLVEDAGLIVNVDVPDRHRLQTYPRDTPSEVISRMAAQDIGKYWGENRRNHIVLIAPIAPKLQKRHRKDLRYYRDLQHVTQTIQTHLAEAGVITGTDWCYDNFNGAFAYRLYPIGGETPRLKVLPAKSWKVIKKNLDISSKPLSEYSSPSSRISFR
ncbi:MAG TPA: hypothetical protein ENN60_01395 [archaeon]|nr:hypothetical protein [archaeon]